MTNVVVVVGAGQIGQAIARRVGVGKHVLLADQRPDNTHAAAEVLANALKADLYGTAVEGGIPEEEDSRILPGHC